MKWTQRQSPMPFHVYKILAGTSQNTSYTCYCIKRHKHIHLCHTLMLFHATQSCYSMSCNQVIPCHEIMLLHAMQLCYFMLGNRAIPWHTIMLFHATRTHAICTLSYQA